MLDPAPDNISLQEAAEWLVRALLEEGFPILLCGRYAVDLQGEYTGSVDADVLIGIDFGGALRTLDAYVDRGDLYFAGGTPRGVSRYLVTGLYPVDVLDVSTVHPELFEVLRSDASVTIHLGEAGDVQAVSREGYFVLAVMIGLRGFASEKRDPMAKVREAKDLFGERTDFRVVQALLTGLGAGEGALDEALGSSG